MTQQQQQEPGDTTPPADAEPQTTGGSADCAGCDADGPQGYGYTGDKKRYLARLRRIEGRSAASTGWSRRTSTASTC